MAAIVRPTCSHQLFSSGKSAMYACIHSPLYITRDINPYDELLAIHHSNCVFDQRFVSEVQR
jgi:hypothetical protein